MDYIELELTKGYVALISHEDVELADFHWAAQVVNGWVYATRAYRSDGKVMHEQLGRVIMARMLGYAIPSEPKYVIDYINENTLDNRRENMRLATYAERCAHRKRQRTAKNPYEGVDFRKDCTRRPWAAVINCQGKFRLIGNYSTPEEAHEAYMARKKELYGEFAY